MTVDEKLRAIRDVIQQDVGNRGLRSDPASNLVTACTADFEAACRSLAAHPAPAVCVVTGFFIPHGQPPACETDGPLGAVFLARALSALRIPVLLVADQPLERALEAGLDAAGVFGESHDTATAYIGRPPHDIGWVKSVVFPDDDEGWTHLIALERVGPSHTPASVRAQPGGGDEVVEDFRRAIPAAAHDRCHSMRGRDLTEFTGPAHVLFEHAARPSGTTTIGIGDGGNEIGMGKIPWNTIRRNIPNGGQVACRVSTDHLIVCGVSNWGAYALAAGILLLRGMPPDPRLFDPDRERRLLQTMVEQGPLVDGVTGKQTATVDGLSWEQYAEPLRRIGQIMTEG